ncbi:MAG: hypothetical protein MZU97_11670 [Bacillus subtilis]|nr:hypothetical protein [Bacillus subtilis]
MTMALRQSALATNRDRDMMIEQGPCGGDPSHDPKRGRNDEAGDGTAILVYVRCCGDRGDRRRDRRDEETRTSSTTGIPEGPSEWCFDLASTGSKRPRSG